MAVTKPKMTTSFIEKNKYSRPATKRAKTTKIAWHYTGQADTSAKATMNYFKNLAKTHATYASSHFVCGLEGEIYYIVPLDEIAYTTNSANSYSIGIECATTGKDDHYTDEQYKSMVKLGAWLAQEYDLDPREDFIRHYDVTKKVCPRYFVNNSKKWEQFKLDCYNYMKGKLKDSGIRNCTNGKGNSILASETVYKTGVYRVITDTLNIRAGAGTSYAVVATTTKGSAYTIDKISGNWGHLKSDLGWINITSTYCQYVDTSKTNTTTTSAPTEKYTTGVYKVKVNTLNVRSGAGTSYAVVDTVSKGSAYTITKVSGEYGYLKSGAGWICISSEYCDKIS